ncbi:MAG: GspE/PulE family protein, partial [Phycisphaerae bacterium]
MARTRKKLGEILLSWGLINENALADALQFASDHSKRVGEALVELELCSEDDVCKALATQFGFEYVDLDKVVEQRSLDLIPTELIRKHMILPIGNEDGRLKIVITDPLDIDTLDLLRFRLNTELTPTLAPPSRVKRYIDTFVDTDSDELSKTMASIDQEAPDQPLLEGEIEGGDDGGGDAPIVRLVNLLISEAVHNRASDIHIEPMADRVRVRYRVDGVCHIRDDVPKDMQAAVTTRFKILSGMDIAEKRVPQDGRIKMKFGDKQIDFRVSALPSYHGESVVLRILRPESAQVGIEQLGFEEDNYQVFQRIIRRPNGIFLVTGPTGSG